MVSAAPPTFWVGNIPVYGDLILSPMDGYSDRPFRSIVRQLGSAMSYTEFINARDILFGHPHLEYKLSYLEIERPVVYQIFDDDPDRLVNAALRVRERNPDIIDVNMGCSARCVANRGAGAALLQNPQKIAEIFSRLSRELDIPITGKIRLGWDDTQRNYRDIARIIEDNGGQLIAIHGRTKKQGYGGMADWDAIAEVKRIVSIPVIGNGDVCTPSDIEKMKTHTGCDGVMIGRAAIGNPWIFSRMDRSAVPVEMVRQMVFNHLAQMQEFYGPEVGLKIFRKHVRRYIMPFPESMIYKERLLTTTNTKEFLHLVEEIISSQSAG